MRLSTTKAREAISVLCDLQKSLISTMSNMIDYTNDPRLGGEMLEGIGVLEREIESAKLQLLAICKPE